MSESPRQSQARLCFALALLLLSACDSSYGEFLNNVPVADERSSAPPTHVFLGVDGVSRAAFDAARAQGAFANWSDADWISFFPAVSDYSWMRMLRAGQMPGYELQYFDPVANELHNEGLAGVVEHPLSQGLIDSLPCWEKFDFLGNGETWTIKGYLDPEAALPATLRDMFRVLERLGRTQQVALAYLMNVDVVSHSGGIERATAMLVELHRQIAAFQARHPGRFTFTMFSDHGNAHQKAELIDPNILLREVGVPTVEVLSSPPRLEAIPIVHVRVNFVSVHTHPSQAQEVARRASEHKWVDLAVVDLGPVNAPGPDPTLTAQTPYGQRFGVYKQGRLLSFVRLVNGDFVVERPQSWDELLGSHLSSHPAQEAIVLTAEQTFEQTRGGAYPDAFYRIATAFTDPTIEHAPQVLLSLPDNIASFGFHLPGGGDHAAVDGFHGALTRGSSLSVIASQGATLPPASRAADLLQLFPDLKAHLQR